MTSIDLYVLILILIIPVAIPAGATIVHVPAAADAAESGAVAAVGRPLSGFVSKHGDGPNSTGTPTRNPPRGDVHRWTSTKWGVPMSMLKLMSMLNSVFQSIRSEVEVLLRLTPRII